MVSPTDRHRERNLAIVLLLAFITAYTAWNEGYYGLVTMPFLLILVGGFSALLWLALNITTTRLLTYIFIVFGMQYVGETIGTRPGMWTYKGETFSSSLGGAYNFGAWIWVMASLLAYVISTRFTIRWIRAFVECFPKWVNPLLVVAVFAVIPLTLGEYWDNLGDNNATYQFWIYFSVLALIGIAASLKTDSPVILGVIIAACIVAIPSEYAGSIGSHPTPSWTFNHDENFPHCFYYSDAGHLKYWRNTRLPLLLPTNGWTNIHIHGEGDMK